MADIRLKSEDRGLQKQNSKGAAQSYAWVVLAVLFVGHIISFGMRSSFQAYISPWELEFSISRTVVTSISMLGFVVFALSQPFAGKLNDIFGKGVIPTIGVILVGVSLFLTSRTTQIWQVFALYGVMFSLGVACCTNSIVAAIVTNWFDKKRGLALGLSMSGLAVGQLILVPANMFIIERLGWRTAMGALGIFVAVVIGPLFIFLLRSSPEEKGLKPYGHENAGDDAPINESKAPERSKSLPVFNLFRKKAFWLLVIPYFLCGFTDVGIVGTHLYPMSQEKGFSTAGVALAISFVAVANITGTIVTGHLSDLFNRKRQLAVLYTLRAATFVLLIFLQQQWLLLVFAIAFGATEMASIAPTNSLAVQLFEGYSVGVVLGIVALSHQLGGAVGSWVPGLLYDLTGSYSTILFTAVFVLLCGAWMSLRLHVPGKQ